MIKPTKIDSLNMADSMTYKCNKCGDSGEISYRFSTENWEEQYRQSTINCPNCGVELSII